jgi:hypothetical protein
MLLIATERCAAKNRYSITSSARASSVGEISKPSAFAVARLITSSNFVGDFAQSIDSRK